MTLNPPPSMPFCPGGYSAIASATLLSASTLFGYGRVTKRLKWLPLLRHCLAIQYLSAALVWGRHILHCLIWSLALETSSHLSILSHLQLSNLKWHLSSKAPAPWLQIVEAFVHDVSVGCGEAIPRNQEWILGKILRLWAMLNLRHLRSGPTLL